MLHLLTLQFLTEKDAVLSQKTQNCSNDDLKTTDNAVRDVEIREPIIFDIPDDLWILTFYYLLPSELLSIIPLTCKHFHKLSNTKTNRSKYNTYWQIQTKLLNRVLIAKSPNFEIEPNYQTNDWYSLFVQLKQFCGTFFKRMDMKASLTDMHIWDPTDSYSETRVILFALHYVLKYDYHHVLKVLLSRESNYILNKNNPLVSYWMKCRALDDDNNDWIRLPFRQRMDIFTACSRFFQGTIEIRRQWPEYWQLQHSHHDQVHVDDINININENQLEVNLVENGDLLGSAVYHRSIKCIKYLLKTFTSKIDVDNDMESYNDYNMSTINNDIDRNNKDAQDVQDAQDAQDDENSYNDNYTYTFNYNNVKHDRQRKIQKGKGKTIPRSAIVLAMIDTRIIDLLIRNKYPNKFDYKDLDTSRLNPLNNRKWHLLHRACHMRHEGYISYLVDRGADMLVFDTLHRSPLLVLCQRNAYNSIRALLTHAAKMKHDIGSKVLQFVKKSHWKGKTQLAIANSNRLSNDEKKYLSRFKDYTYDTIVVWATEENKPEILEYILKLSFELGLLDSSKHEHTMLGEKPNGMGKPPLAIAISYNRNDIAKMLILKFNVDVDYCKSGNRYASILYMACLKGMTDVVLALLSYMKDLKKNIDVGYQFPNDGGHETPLMIASLKGHIDIVRILLKHGANTNAQNDEGRTALDIARNAKNDNVVRCIRGFNKLH